MRALHAKLPAILSSLCVFLMPFLLGREQCSHCSLLSSLSLWEVTL